MSKTNNPQYPVPSPVGRTEPCISYVCRLPQAFVAQSIQEDPSGWVEIPLPNGNELGTPIHGANIQLPVVGNEYFVTFGRTDADNAFCMHFFSYLHSLASVRLFCLKGTALSFVCTDASDEVMRMVLTLVQQTIEQKFGDGKLIFSRDSEC